MDRIEVEPRARLQADMQARVVCELAEHMDTLDRLASVFVGKLIAEAVSGSARRLHMPGLHPAFTKMVRDLVDDEVVRAISAGELGPAGRLAS